MTSTAQTWGLPDPDDHAEFYADVTTKRFIAWIADTCIIFALTLLILPFTAFMGLFVYPILWIAIGFTYRSASISAGSATLGMRLMSIQLRNRQGARFDAATALGHTFLYYAMASLVVLQAISVLFMLIGARGQGLHDMMLGTAAINTPDDA